MKAWAEATVKTFVDAKENEDAAAKMEGLAVFNQTLQAVEQANRPAAAEALEAAFKAIGINPNTVVELVEKEEAEEVADPEHGLTPSQVKQ